MTLTIPEIPEDADNLTAALLYAEAGLYVGPAKRTSKNPGSLLGACWQTRSSRDPGQIAAWFAGTDHDVFLHAGRSGLVIFDRDHTDQTPAVLDKYLDMAPCQSSRPDEPGRAHYIFAQPEGMSLGNGTGKLGSRWGNIRGRNGVIMAFPSAHQDGGEYRWLRTGPVPVVPEEIVELILDGRPPRDPAGVAESATDAEVLAFIAEHTVAVRPGVLDGRAKGYSTVLSAGHGRHDATVPFLTGAMEEAAAGLFSAQTAIDRLWPISWPR